ncbi:MAG: hypothetical protein WC350_03955 [Candidatus Micrarchaeia archaeon]
MSTLERRGVSPLPLGAKPNAGKAIGELKEALKRGWKAGSGVGRG